MQVDNVEVPVRGVGEGEIPTPNVEVHHLAQRQLAAVVEVGAGELHFTQLRRLDAAKPAHAVDDGPRAHQRPVAVVIRLIEDTRRIEGTQDVNEPFSYPDVGEGIE